MDNQNNQKGVPAAQPAPVDNLKRPPYGICPIISTVQAVVSKLNAPPLGMVEGVKSFQQSEIVPVNLASPCIGPNCAWFVEDWNGCVIRALGRLKDISQNMELQSQPHSDELPVILNRLADICEKMGLLMQHTLKKRER